MVGARIYRSIVALQYAQSTTCDRHHWSFFDLLKAVGGERYIGVSIAFTIHGFHSMLLNDWVGHAIDRVLGVSSDDPAEKKNASRS